MGARGAFSSSVQTAELHTRIQYIGVRVVSMPASLHLWQMRTRISDPLERLKRVMPREVLQSEVGWRARFDADQLVEKISLYAPVFYSTHLPVSVK